ncbi:hypothetical protein [Salmonella enterica subsp. enterica serovar Rissen]|nr:hypothetical protein [Salmonella enterica subsp. enterica serovar Rissen]
MMSIFRLGLRGIVYFSLKQNGVDRVLKSSWNEMTTQNSV